TRLPVGRSDHGHAAVAADGRSRRCADRACAEAAATRRRTSGAGAMSDVAPLEAEIRTLIRAAGPMPVWRYMQLCLTHPRYGYYIARDPLGREGDFITAPEVSQMFGELIGLWAASVWRMMDEPAEI